MACRNICKLCPKLIISQAVVFTGGNLVITIPAGSYNNNCKYCIVVAQAIPATTTINSPVVIQIGTGAQLYTLTKCNCRPVTACGIRTRTKYSVCVETTPTSAIFKMLGNPCCQPNNDLRSVNGTAPVAEAAESEV